MIQRGQEKNLTVKVEDQNMTILTRSRKGTPEAQAKGHISALVLIKVNLMIGTEREVGADQEIVIGKGVGVDQEMVVEKGVGVDQEMVGEKGVGVDQEMVGEKEAAVTDQEVEVDQKVVAREEVQVRR